LYNEWNDENQQKASILKNVFTKSGYPVFLNKDQDNCKPDSVFYGYLSRFIIADELKRPTHRYRTGNPQSPAYAVLLRMGFT